jgi:hypothetical protein
VGSWALSLRREWKDDYEMMDFFGVVVDCGHLMTEIEV